MFSCWLYDIEIKIFQNKIFRKLIFCEHKFRSDFPVQRPLAVDSDMCNMAADGL